MHDSVPDAAATTAESGWSIRQQLTLGSAESAFSLIRAGMLPGVSVKNRTGHGGEILIVIYGKAAVTIGGSTKDLSAGHALSISGSVEYAITANDDPLEIAVVRWASGHVRSINGTLPQSSVRALDRANMEWAYEMYLSPLFDAQQISGLPFGSSYGSVPPKVHRSITATKTANFCSSSAARPEYRWARRSGQRLRGILPSFHPF